MKHEPLVSIVIATYNRAWCITRAVDSVLKQTYPNYEIVIVDDGSTDDTEGVVRGLGSDKIRYFKFEKNQGQMPAKDFGIKQCEGEWIIILDSDNEMVEHCIETFVKKIDALESDRIKMLVANVHDTGVGGKRVDPYWEKRFSLSPVVDFDTLICHRGFGELFHCTHRSVFEKVPFLTRSRRNTQIIWYKCYRYTDIFYFDDVLSIYHTDGDDRITNNRSKDAMYWVDGMQEFIDEFEKDIVSRCPRQMAFYLKSLAIYFYYTGDKKQFYATLIKALGYDKTNIALWVYMVLGLSPKLFDKFVNR